MIKSKLIENSLKGDYRPSKVDYIILDDRYMELSFEWFTSGKWEMAKLKVRCLLKLSNQEPSQGLDSSADNGTKGCITIHRSIPNTLAFCDSLSDVSQKYFWVYLGISVL